MQVEVASEPDRRAWRRWVRLARPPQGRHTNLTLLLALVVTFATGTGAVATGSAHGRWVVIGHGIGAMAVVLLIPWKSRVVRGGLRRRRRTRWMSLTLAGMVIATLIFGLGYSSGLVRTVDGTEGMWLHIAFALALVPLLLWHLFARQSRPRRTDLSRRTLMRTGALAVAAGGLYVATSAVVTVAGLPGTRRRFTGSYETGSFDPPSMPNTIWLDDSTPLIDTSTWRLTVVDARGRRSLSLDDLRAYDTTVRATLDCTSGWYARQDWTGAPVADLLRDVGEARSLLVHSTTGYWLRFPISDVPHLLLATAVGGDPLSDGHGYPARMVAPNKRGFWWVKWVDRIEVQSTPWWWQPPFPLT